MSPHFRLLFKLAGNKDILYILSWMSLKIGQIRPQTTNELPLSVQKSPYTYYWENGAPTFLGCLYPILLMVLEKKDSHRSLDELKYWPDQTTDYGVSIP